MTITIDHNVGNVVFIVECNRVMRVTVWEVDVSVRKDGIEYTSYRLLDATGELTITRPVGLVFSTLEECLQYLRDECIEDCKHLDEHEAQR